MRKRICVFIGEIAQDYQKLIANSIKDKANELGYDVVFICNYGSYNEDILYADGERSCVHLPDCSTFDGIIVAEDIFDIDGMPDDLYEIIKKTAKCPVVYLRSEREGFYSVMAENKSSLESVVRHFTDYHKFTDICYMSGKADAEDAQERLNGFLDGMKEKGIEVNEHMIFHGDYWRFKGEEALNWFMEGRKKYPEAIICANDYMALSICEALKRRGIRIPDDVCVSGFDYLEEAKYSNPSLTSLEVDFKGMVDRAVEIIDNVNNGKKEEMSQRISAKLHLSRSCNCGKQHYISDYFDILAINHRLVDDTKNSFISITEYQTAFGFDEFMAVADKFRRFIRTNKAFICFNDNTEDGYDEVENDSYYTKSMVLKRIFEKDNPAQSLNEHFSRTDIIPKKYWSDTKPNNFCVFPIHFKNVVYGYCVAEVPEDKWFDIQTQGYFMALANAIQNSNLHLEIQQLESIKDLYQNDPLTGIYNRRGFDKMFKTLFQQAKNGGTPIGIASIDMDNLKTINDTYGHMEGDKALITLANALKKVTKNGDICARIGGDEFAALINITSPNRSAEFKKEFSDALIEESAKANVKNVVSASIGICETSETESNTMFSCIHLADKRMYEDKRNKRIDR